jgi:hypothetical protein
MQRRIQPLAVGGIHEVEHRLLREQDGAVVEEPAAFWLAMDAIAASVNRSDVSIRRRTVPRSGHAESSPVQPRSLRSLQPRSAAAGPFVEERDLPALDGQDARHLSLVDEITLISEPAARQENPDPGAVVTSTLPVRATRPVTPW